jgi:hypothetical protein
MVKKDLSTLSDIHLSQIEEVKKFDPNIVAIHSNTISVAMINKHYQDLSDDNLVNIHNQLYPERTRKQKSTKNY